MSYFEDALRIVAGNLQFTKEKKDGIDPLQMGQIAEIAAIMAAANRAPYDKEELFRIWNEAQKLVKEKVDTVALAGAYWEKLSKDGFSYKELPAIENVYYLRNRGSDGAFDHFTYGSQGVRAGYVSGHLDALENCYDEDNDACILPFSDPERGLHTGFRAMILRYGLKIAQMVRIEDREGTALDYVLLRREVEVPKGDCYLAITLSLDDGCELQQVLHAAAQYGVKVENIFKLPELMSSTPGYDLHFFGQGDKIELLMFYLMLEHPRHELFGIYQKDKEKI